MIFVDPFFNIDFSRIASRSLRIVAEAFSIKGLCLEQESPASSKFKQAERETEMIKCFELASDLSLLYMQELDKQQTNITSTSGTYLTKELKLY